MAYLRPKMNQGQRMFCMNSPVLVCDTPLAAYKPHFLSYDNEQPYHEKSNDRNYLIGLSLPTLTDPSEEQVQTKQIDKSSPSNQFGAPKRPSRKGQEKTELCTFLFDKLVECPFGEKCAFAHGKDELKVRSFSDYDIQHLSDAHQFRSRPCCDLLSMGSCPFKSRCAFIHDPNLERSNESSFLFKDMPSRGNDTKTSVAKCKYVIDPLYHCRTSVMRHGNPLGFKCESFEDVLANVCQSSQEQPSLGPFSSRIRLEIALLMRGGDDRSHFTFWPTHKLFKTDGCMIIQEKEFLIEMGTAKVTALSFSDTRNEALMDMIQNHNDYMKIKVHELVFGPVFKHGVPHPALYFDLHQDDLVAFPLKDQKEYVNSLKKRSEKNLMCPSDPEAIAKKRYQSSRPPFRIVRPIDKDAFHLVTTLMNHSLSQLKADEALSTLPAKMELDRDAQSLIEVNDMSVRQDFENNKSLWINWVQLPRNHGLKVPLSLTEAVPSNQCKYVINEDCDDTSDLHSHKNISKLWSSFVGTKGGTSLTHNDVDKPHRLPVFVGISNEGAPFRYNEQSMPLLSNEPEASNLQGKGPCLMDTSLMKIAINKW